jgi:hypothetical protein
MKNCFIFWLFILVIVLLSSCISGLEKKDRSFSLSISESKLNNTFIKEYNSKIKINNDSLKLTINRAWLEKSCFYKADSFKCSDSVNKTLLMDMSLNNNLYLNKMNFLDKWIIATKDTNFAGKLRDLYGISFYKNEQLKDIIELKIYALDSNLNVNQGLKCIGSIEFDPK